MRHEVDVLVIGAGPGGSMAARAAAESGAEALMVEKRQEVGSPVRCGEGIAEDWLKEIGLSPDRRWIAHRVDGARLISPGGHVLTMDAARAGNETGFVIERDAFDRSLAAAAVRAGSDLWMRAMAMDARMEGNRITGVKVVRLGEEITIVPKVVIAADGFESRVAEWVGLSSRLAPKEIDSCLQYRLVGVSTDEQYNDFYVGSMAPGGYVWVFHKGEGVANVGIGVQVSRLRDRAGVKAHLDRFIAGHEGLRDARPVDIVAGAVSTSLPMDRTVKGNLLLVGDAARMVDPLTGGGVVYACRSGMMAGRIAGEFVRDGEPLDRYERMWRREFENALVRNFVAKEKAVELSDKTFDRVIAALSELEITRITTSEIISAVGRVAPELLEEIDGLL
ncbi:MAG TPA: NAD(P)/FAD-dependent oxidoreductase [Thermoplasmata archaeon]|nr:NAD(P)/FAD-dependent oxidoreductase [Thermoplasmata archaeon]